MGTKSNQYREFYLDSHYLFSRNKQRKEFCLLFKDDSCILSMDDMAKIKVGAPAVSQYQLRRMYPTADMPNFHDHDYPVTNYLGKIVIFLFRVETKWIFALFRLHVS